MRILVTGAAGFIGFHLAKRFLDCGDEVVGLDNLNEYYDVRLKEMRLQELKRFQRFHFYKIDLADQPSVETLFIKERFDRVVHMAAQAGVRYSVSHPHVYAHSNLVGFLHILEGCRQQKVPHLLFASSSSVYGSNTKVPFSVQDPVDHPTSLYGATKRSNELMAHAYSHLYGLPTTGLRFFTVYGPWGRPDMAYFQFTESILRDRPIDVFHHGQLKRDFTFIDDIVEVTLRLVNSIPVSCVSGGLPNPGASFSPYRLYNVGHGESITVLDLIRLLEEELHRKAKLNFLEMQKGDVLVTQADVSPLKASVGCYPETPLSVGMKKFLTWYNSSYRKAGTHCSASAEGGQS